MGIGTSGGDGGFGPGVGFAGRKLDGDLRRVAGSALVENPDRSDNCDDEHHDGDQHPAIATTVARYDDSRLVVAAHEASEARRGQPYLGCFGANLPKPPMNRDTSNSGWFYCLDHKAVEPEEGCRAEVRLGPYPTREEAARALEKVEERNEDWDNDPAWNDEKDE